MAFTSTVTDRTVQGNKRVVKGTFASTGGSTGGDIVTGLNVLESLIPVHSGTVVVASAPVVNETFPVSGGTATIVTVANTSGTFYAEGH